jgi:hypothetical protein
VHKAFAGRDRDWLDVEGIVIRQGEYLDSGLVLRELAPLAALKDDDTIDRLQALFGSRLGELFQTAVDNLDPRRVRDLSELTVSAGGDREAAFSVSVAFPTHLWSWRQRGTVRPICSAWTSGTSGPSRRCGRGLQTAPY